MKNFVVIPDSFKGSVSSAEVCEIMERCIHKHVPDAVVKKIPIADGGEGTVDSFLAALNGEKIHTTVQGPHGEKVDGFYAVVNNGKTAVIEMAACAGLPLAEVNLNPSKTTTYGVGELMLHAIQSGCTEIIMGLGGSATNDFGAGMAAALGVVFYNKNGENFIPVGGTLGEVADIDTTKATALLQGITVTAMCDIQNPLYGENGAAYIFAPQKGADAAMVQELDSQLRQIALVVKETQGVDCSTVAGGGAAGGMGAGLYSLLGATLKSGIDTILDIVEFDNLASKADVVFTGEGRIDAQSTQGKVIAGLAKRAKLQKVPLIAVVGDILDPIDAMYEMGLTAAVSINRLAVDFSVAKKRSKIDLANTMDSILRLLLV